eukprot:TRINITY_DN18167_c0_g1_i1.p3 TRINITY_DN18167_c0_g1~~TRINITY_DN18167_c0_g1_i1.p3  ORF type:complete len:115 (+),score=18.51 TRINITY_DN18167_c0_g1_i1:503-847(+)
MCTEAIHHKHTCVEGEHKCACCAASAKARAALLVRKRIDLVAVLEPNLLGRGLHLNALAVEEEAIRVGVYLHVGAPRTRHLFEACVPFDLELHALVVRIELDRNGDRLGLARTF